MGLITSFLDIYTFFITVIFTLDSDISEVCESNGTISLCLLASDMVGLVVEVDVQLNDVTTQGNKRDQSTIILFRNVLSGSEDYILETSTLTFGPQNDLRQCADIMLVNDEIPDGSVESFTYEFSSAHDGAMLPQSGSITIVDDEREYIRSWFIFFVP